MTRLGFEPMTLVMQNSTILQEITTYPLRHRFSKQFKINYLTSYVHHCSCPTLIRGKYQLSAILNYTHYSNRARNILLNPKTFQGTFCDVITTNNNNWTKEVFLGTLIFILTNLFYGILFNTVFLLYKPDANLHFKPFQWNRAFRF